MKLVLEPVYVSFAPPTRPTVAGFEVPTAFRWRQRTYRIDAVAECWTYRGRWWLDPVRLQGESRCYFRIHCSRGADGRSRATDGQLQENVFEIYRQGDTWMLSRVWD
jgi:hypothetical protein